MGGSGRGTAPILYVDQAPLSGFFGAALVRRLAPAARVPAVRRAAGLALVALVVPAAFGLARGLALVLRAGLRAAGLADASADLALLRADPPVLLLPLLLLPAGAIILRTTSLAAETKAAPIRAALSAAASAPSAASRPAFFAVLRTLELVLSAAAAATRPAASMLRAIGFWASSAARWPASRNAAGILSLVRLDFFAAPLLVLLFLVPLLLPRLDLLPVVFAFAIAYSPGFITAA